MAAAGGGADPLTVDPRLLGRSPPFDGNEAQWTEWVFQTRAYLEVLDRDVADSIDLVEANLQTELALARLNVASKDAGRKVYFILTQCFAAQHCWS